MGGASDQWMVEAKSALVPALERGLPDIGQPRDATGVDVPVV